MVFGGLHPATAHLANRLHVIFMVSLLFTGEPWWERLSGPYAGCSATLPNPAS